MPFKNKAEEKAYKKAYREANKEKIKVRDKIYREANKEKMKAYNKEYREANKEEIRVKRKEYREANKGKIKVKNKEYNEANKEKIKSQKKREKKELKKKENKRRKKLGLPLVGEGFKKEMELLFYVSHIFEGETIILHDRIILNGLELDIYIPSFKLAFEYQGVQHYKIGGLFIKTREQFQIQQSRDRRKKELCQQKGIILIEVRYDEKLSEQLILEKLKNYSFELKQKRF